MLQRSRSEIGVNNVARLVVELCDPFCELHAVGNGGRKENITNGVRKKNDSFLPYHTSICDVTMPFPLSYERHRVARQDEPLSLI
jgi:hypothetical protein